MSYPVIIIGAGVSGLALAQGLLRTGRPFRVFERDPTLHARTQGYRVRISEEGINALEQNLPPTRYEKLKRCCARVSASTGNAPTCHLDAVTAGPAEGLFKAGQPPPITAGGKPLSADRTVLREVLSEDLEQHLEFGKEFETHEEDDEGVVVAFTDGSTVKGCLLVGADGAWSRVRQRILPSYSLLDTEGRLVYGKSEMTEKLASHFSTRAMTTDGMTLIRDPESGLLCLLEPMRFEQSEDYVPTDYIYWALFLRKDREMPDKDLLRLTAGETSAFVQRLTGQWHPSARCLFDGAQMSVVRVISTKPPIPNLEHHPMATLVGDAVHPMAPTAAYGATTALNDAGVLAKALERVETAAEIRSAIKVYENKMRVYSNDALVRSSMGGKVVFGMRPFDELPDVSIGTTEGRTM